MAIIKMLFPPLSLFLSPDQLAEIWEKSESHNIQYTIYHTDGDYPCILIHALMQTMKYSTAPEFFQALFGDKILTVFR